MARSRRRLVTAGWSVEQRRGDPGAFHRREVPAPAVRAAWVFVPDRPTLVLGSTQPDTDVDRAAAERLGVAVVRRRSGGGAVLLDPGEVVWVDLVVPRDDPLWRDDVGRAFHWLGRAWSSALEALGWHDAEVHEGPLAASPASPVVCFAGLGPGEVTVGGRKLVGLSQRRTRAAARFQSALLLRWRPARVAALLGPGLARVGVGAEALAELPVAAAEGVEAEVAVAALLDALP